MPPTPSHPAARSDQELIRAYQDGDQGAFVELVERYRLELFHFLARFVNDRVAAEDVFQEAFLQVHISVDSFDTERPFKPWLFTIAANKARDYLRRTNRTASHITSLPDAQGDGDRAMVELMDAQLPEPGELVVNQETRRLVKEVVGSLPDHLREILLLAYFHQIPYKDIARTLNIPLGTVKSRLHAAVGTFAQAWKQRQEPSGKDSD